MEIKDVVNSIPMEVRMMSNEFEVQYQILGSDYVNSIILGYYSNGIFTWKIGSYSIVQIFNSPYFTYKIFDEYGKKYSLKEFLIYITKKDEEE